MPAQGQALQCGIYRAPVGHYWAERKYLSDYRDIRTFQEIYELISRESELVTSGFAGSDAATDIIEHRNPLCFESLRDYFHRMIQGLHNKSGNDIVRFKEDLKIAAKELV